MWLKSLKALFPEGRGRRPAATGPESVANGPGCRLPATESAAGSKRCGAALARCASSKDGAKARRYHKSECSRLEVLKVCERARRAWGKLSRTGDPSPRCAHAHKTQSQLNLSQLNLS